MVVREVERFWSDDIGSKRCVSEDDYDALLLEHAASQAKVHELQVQGYKAWVETYEGKAEQDKEIAEAVGLLRELQQDHTLMLQMGASEFGPTECKTLRMRLVKLRAYLSRHEEKANG
jgi:hypothetical protein